MSKARDIARAGTALSSVDATELGYLDGVTSSVQTQIDSKLATTTASSTYATSSTVSTHTGASTGVHGVTGSVVGTTDTQTLSSKTLTSPIFNYGYSVAAIREATNIQAQAASGTVTVDLGTAGSAYFTVASTGNFILNIRGNGATTINSLMNVGDMWTFSLLVTNTTAYYLTSLQLDGTTSGVTMKWSGGTTPSAGNANAIDVYSFTIIKTASATYTVLAAGPVKYA